ncbi:Sensor protein CpxA [compost metagenome]
MLDLTDIVSAVVDDARFEAGEQQLRIVWDPQAPVPIIGDRDSLSSAIENVMRNALRFAPAHSAIRVRLLESADVVGVEIEDRGPGVSQEDLESLFEPFFRAASGANTPGSGAGLGLSIAQAAVAAHKGRIRARNVSPQGLSVRIELPREARQPLPTGIRT